VDGGGEEKQFSRKARLLLLESMIVVLDLTFSGSNSKQQWHSRRQRRLVGWELLYCCLKKNFPDFHSPPRLARRFLSSPGLGCCVGDKDQ